MSKGNKGFGSMFTEGLDDEENLDKATPADGIMASRSQTLARIATGENGRRPDGVGRSGAVPPMADAQSRSGSFERR